MIIRILAEGQYSLEGKALTELDAMDDFLLDAISAGDEKQFASHLQRVVELIRTKGEKIADEELVESDLVIPDPEISLEEARDLFADYPRDLC